MAITSRTPRGCVDYHPKWFFYLPGLLTILHFIFNNFTYNVDLK